MLGFFYATYPLCFCHYPIFYKNANQVFFIFQFWCVQCGQCGISQYNQWFQRFAMWNQCGMKVEYLSQCGINC